MSRPRIRRFSRLADGKSAHGDTDAILLFFSRTKGTFAGFDLDGVTLKADDSMN